MDISNNSQISCSNAISSSVKTARDESVGSIKDIIINPSTNKISYIVLKVDEGFLNLGSKLLALPPESFVLNPAQDDVVMVKESKETLKNAPGFDSDKWPSGPQTEFLHTMRTYYSEGSRSLEGRYDHVNRTYLNNDTILGSESSNITDRHSGDGFLEIDHRGDRQSDRRRGGEPLL
jgi:sporulation protein YlmC with PRC-barrel domain